MLNVYLIVITLFKLAITNYINMMAKNSILQESLRLYFVYGPLEDESRLTPNLVNY